MADLAVRYAEALLKAAKFENVLPVVTDEMEYLAHEFSKSAKVFYAPVFSIRNQVACVNDVLKDKFHPLTKRFILMLAAMRRLGGIEKITETFRKLAFKEMGQIDLYITVYEELKPEMMKKLVQAACDKKLFAPQYKENINLHISFDKSIKGGFIIECEDMRWDCSLRTRLYDLSKVISRI